MGAPYNKAFKCGSEEIVLEHTEIRKIAIRNDSLNVMGTKLRVGSGGCAQIGLPVKVASEIRRKHSKNSGKTISDKDYLIKDRNPILMIHVLNADYVAKKDEQQYPPYLFAVGVGFPEDATETLTATYVVNLVDLSNWIDVNSEDEE